MLLMKSSSRLCCAKNQSANYTEYSNRVVAGLQSVSPGDEVGVQMKVQPENALYGTP